MSQFRSDREPEIDFFEIFEGIEEKRIFALIIYDIIDNKARIKFAKFLQGYGTRVQKSAFEAFLTQEKYHKLLREIPRHIKKEDNVIFHYRMLIKILNHLSCGKIICDNLLEIIAEFTE